MFKRTDEPNPGENIPVSYESDAQRALSLMESISADLAAMRASQPEALDVYQLFTETLVSGVDTNFRVNMTPVYWLIVVNNIAGAPAAFTVEISQGERIYPNDRIVLNFLATTPMMKVRLLAKQYNLTLRKNLAGDVTAMVIGTSNPHVDVEW